MRPLRSSPFAALRFALLSAFLPAWLLLGGCRSHESPGLTKVTIQADWYPQPEHGGFYEALSKGYYKAEGLDVEIRPGGPYVNSEALVASGAIEFGMNSSDHVLEAVANSGEPLVAVGATMQHDPQGIMVRADSPVHTWADLDGRTIAVRPGSTWWEFIEKKFNLTHVKEVPATYSVANFLQDPNYIQQAFATSEPFFAQKAGVAPRMLMNSDAGFDPYRVFYTSQAFLKQHPDIVAKFTQASIKGWRDYMNDPAATNALLLRLNPALNPEWEQFSWSALNSGHYVTGRAPGGSDLGQFDPARWQTLYQQLLDLRVIQKPIDPTTAYTTLMTK